MSELEPVKSIVTPTRLEYEYTAVGAQARFLDEISRGRIIGQRCPQCRKVYVPARGACPRCGVATAETVEVSGKGTVTTFCVVRVPSENIHLKLPFVAAASCSTAPTFRSSRLVERLRGERRAHGPARRGGLGAARGVGADLRQHPPLSADRRARRRLREVQGAPLMREVAVVSFAQTPYVRRERGRSEVEMLMPVIAQAIERSGLTKSQIGFTCSGSSDYLAGQAFAFVGAVDALGAWPPISESHVEMDGAWALYEAWIRSSAATRTRRWSSPSGAVRWARCPRRSRCSSIPTRWRRSAPTRSASRRCRPARCSMQELCTEREMAEVAVRSRRDAKRNPCAQLTGDFEVEKILAEPYLISPLRKHDCPPISDGAAAIVIAAGDRGAPRLQETRVHPRHRPPPRAALSRASATSPLRRRRSWRARRPAPRASPSISRSCTRPSRTRS